MSDTNISLIAYLQRRYSLSRRKITSLIKEKKIFVDWKLVDSYKADIEWGQTIKFFHPIRSNWVEKTVEVNKLLTKVYMFNKPKGYVVSKDDPHNRTIFEILPPILRRGMYYIWRLDKDSHWLILLTNDNKLKS